jgi:hypothetical protein
LLGLWQSEAEGRIGGDHTRKIEGRIRDNEVFNVKKGFGSESRAFNQREKRTRRMPEWIEVAGQSQ